MLSRSKGELFIRHGGQTGSHSFAIVPEFEIKAVFVTAIPFATKLPATEAAATCWMKSALVSSPNTRSPLRVQLLRVVMPLQLWLRPLLSLLRELQWSQRT